MPEKIYCSECRYFCDYNENVYGSKIHCQHSSNVYIPSIPDNEIYRGGV